MPSALNEAAARQLFLDARSVHGFTAEPVSDQTLRELYELCKWGPTAMNAQPMRLVFVRTAQGKALLKQALNPGNVAKSMAAPVTAIVAMDMAFFEHLPTQFPAVPTAASMYAGNAGLAQTTALRNGSLQGAYLMLAARMLGLAVGPMSGFDAARLDADFFPDGRWRSNFLVNLGYAAPGGTHPRGPRLPFEEVVRLA